MNLYEAVDAKIDMWALEAESSARRMIHKGRTATRVTYPTGLEVARFAEPYGECGMHFEVPVETWERLGGRVGRSD